MPLSWGTLAGLQRTGSESPGRASFSFEYQRATENFLVDPLSLQFSTAQRILQALGDVEPDGFGGLHRALPAAHPRWTHLYASQIDPIVSKGRREGDGVKNAELDLEAPPFVSIYWQYGVDEFTIHFTPRPYALLQDASIGFDNVPWFNDAGVAQPPVRVKREWERYTDWEPTLASEFLTAQQGQMVFARESTPVAAIGTPPAQVVGALPHGVPLSGFPKLFIDKQVIRFTWFQVPYSFVRHRNSNFRRWAGRVNQRAWYEWDKGELLYLGFTAKRYTPPIPAREFGWDGSTTFSTEKICDVELIFHEVRRSSPQVPVPVQGNWVAAGHNLHPWFGDRRFYYVVMPSSTARNDTATWKPTYESFPFEFLFRDPSLPL